MDLIPVLANLVSIAIFFLVSDTRATLQFQRPIYGFATLAIWFKVFYFLRMYEEIGHLVRNIFQIIWVMRYFFIMFMFWLIMFTSAFYALTPNTNLMKQLQFTYYITIRRTEVEVFENAETKLESIMLWITFFMCSVFFMYILLNMTVSMVKLFYD